MNDSSNSPRHKRRNQLARERGFSSYAQQRRYQRVAATEAQMRRLPPGARSRRAEALDVIGRARRENLPVAEAAADLNVPMSAVAWWGAPALENPRVRKPKVLKGDRMLRVHPLIVEGELQLVTTRGSQAARHASEAFRIQRAFIEGEPGAAAKLARLSGARVGGRTIETNPVLLDEIGRRGELGDIGEMYRAWVS
jgi:hypothetical protein